MEVLDYATSTNEDGGWDEDDDLLDGLLDVDIESSSEDEKKESEHDELGNPLVYNTNDSNVASKQNETIDMAQNSTNHLNDGEKSLRSLNSGLNLLEQTVGAVASHGILSQSIFDSPTFHERPTNNSNIEEDAILARELKKETDLKKSSLDENEVERSSPVLEYNGGLFLNRLTQMFPSATGGLRLEDNEEENDLEEIGWVEEDVNLFGDFDDDEKNTNNNDNTSEQVSEFYITSSKDDVRLISSLHPTIKKREEISQNLYHVDVVHQEEETGADVTKMNYQQKNSHIEKNEGIMEAKIRVVEEKRNSVDERILKDPISQLEDVKGQIVAHENMRIEQIETIPANHMIENATNSDEGTSIQKNNSDAIMYHPYEGEERLRKLCLADHCMENDFTKSEEKDNEDKNDQILPQPIEHIPRQDLSLKLVECHLDNNYNVTREEMLRENVDEAGVVKNATVQGVNYTKKTEEDDSEKEKYLETIGYTEKGWDEDIRGKIDLESSSFDKQISKEAINQSMNFVQEKLEKNETDTNAVDGTKGDIVNVNTTELSKSLQTEHDHLRNNEILPLELTPTADNISYYIESYSKLDMLDHSVVAEAAKENNGENDVSEDKQQMDVEADVNAKDKCQIDETDVEKDDITSYVEGDDSEDKKPGMLDHSVVAEAAKENNGENDMSEDKQQMDVEVDVNAKDKCQIDETNVVSYKDMLLDNQVGMNESCLDFPNDNSEDKSYDEEEWNDHIYSCDLDSAQEESKCHISYVNSVTNVRVPIDIGEIAEISCSDPSSNSEMKFNNLDRQINVVRGRNDDLENDDLQSTMDQLEENECDTFHIEPMMKAEISSRVEKGVVVADSKSTVFAEGNGHKIYDTNEEDGWNEEIDSFDSGEFQDPSKNVEIDLIESSSMTETKESSSVNYEKIVVDDNSSSLNTESSKDNYIEETNKEQNGHYEINDEGWNDDLENFDLDSIQGQVKDDSTVKTMIDAHLKDNGGKCVDSKSNFENGYGNSYIIMSKEVKDEANIVDDGKGWNDDLENFDLNASHDEIHEKIALNLNAHNTADCDEMIQMQRLDGVKNMEHYAQYLSSGEGYKNQAIIEEKTVPLGYVEKNHSDFDGNLTRNESSDLFVPDTSDVVTFDGDDRNVEGLDERKFHDNDGVLESDGATNGNLDLPPHVASAVSFDSKQVKKVDKNGLNKEKKTEEYTDNFEVTDTKQHFGINQTYLKEIIPTMNSVTAVTSSGKMVQIDYSILLQNEIAKRISMEAKMGTYLEQISSLTVKLKDKDNLLLKSKEAKDDIEIETENLSNKWNDKKEEMKNEINTLRNAMKKVGESREVEAKNHSENTSRLELLVKTKDKEKHQIQRNYDEKVLKLQQKLNVVNSSDSKYQKKLSKNIDSLTVKFDAKSKYCDELCIKVDNLKESIANMRVSMFDKSKEHEKKVKDIDLLLHLKEKSLDELQINHQNEVLLLKKEFQERNLSQSQSKIIEIELELDAKTKLCEKRNSLISTLKDSISKLEFESFDAAKKQARKVRELENIVKSNEEEQKNIMSECEVKLKELQTQIKQLLLEREESLKDKETAKKFLEEKNIVINNLGRQSKEMELNMKGHERKIASELNMKIQVLSAKEESLNSELVQKNIFVKEVERKLLSSEAKCLEVTQKLKAEVSEMRTLVQENKSGYQELQYKYNAISISHEELVHNHESLEEEKNELEEEFEELLVQIGLQKEITAEEMKEYEDSISTLKYQLELQQDQIYSVLNLEQKFEDLSKVHGALKMELDAVKHECHEKELEIQNSSEKSNKLLDQLHHLRMTVDLIGEPEPKEKSASTEDWEALYQNTAKSLSEKTNELHILRNHLERAKNDCSIDLKESEAEKTILKRKDDLIVEYQEKQESIQERIYKIEADLMHSTDQQEELREKLNETQKLYDNAKKEIIVKQDLIDKMEVDLLSFELELNAKDAKSSDINESYSEEQDDLKVAMKEKDKEILELQLNLESIKSSLLTTQAELAEQKMNACGNESKTNGEKDAELQAKKEKNESLEASLIQHESAYQEATLLLEIMNTDIENTHNILTEKEKEINDLVQLVTELEEKLQQSTQPFESSDIPEADTKDEAESVDFMRQQIIYLANALEQSEIQRAEAIDRVLVERKANVDTIKRLKESVKRFYSTLSCS